MENKKLSALTKEELLAEKKKLQKSKIMNAFVIGFLASIVVLGIISAIISKRIALVIPLLFPVYFIYRILTNSKKNEELEAILKERQLDK